MSGFYRTRRALRLALALAWACAEPAPPPVEAHRYELVSVDDRPVPAALDGDPDLRVLDGWYEVRSDSFWRSSDRRATQYGSALVDTAVSVDSGPYIVRGDTMGFKTRPGTFVLWTGVRRGDTLTLRKPDFYADYITLPRTWVYIRR